MSKDHIYIPHSDVEYFGFAITDATVENGDYIWVGAGMEGRWLTSRKSANWRQHSPESRMLMMSATFKGRLCEWNSILRRCES